MSAKQHERQPRGLLTKQVLCQPKKHRKRNGSNQCRSESDYPFVVPEKIHPDILHDIFRVHLTEDLADMRNQTDTRYIVQGVIYRPCLVLAVRAIVKMMRLCANQKDYGNRD